MDWFVAVFGVSLIGSGELDRFKRVYKPRGSEVDPSYWGQYIKEAKEKEFVAIPQGAAIAAATSATVCGIALPKLLKAPEPQGWDKDWTGGPD